MPTGEPDKPQEGVQVMDRLPGSVDAPTVEILNRCQTAGLGHCCEQDLDNEDAQQLGASELDESRRTSRTAVFNCHWIRRYLARSPKQSTQQEEPASAAQQSMFEAYYTPTGLILIDTLIVEDFKPGYPRFAALVGSHTAFHVCRRFGRLRARLLLIKQDELSLLEAQLDEVDHEETKILFLGNRRRDKNATRLDLVSKIDEVLASYGMFEYATCFS